MQEFFCAPCIAAMPAAKFWLVFGAASVLALGALHLARKQIIKARLIEDMPTSRIRSASQGYVELIGLATGRGQLLTAPLSARPCLWWRYTIERYQKSGKSSSWQTLDKGVSREPFYMDDGSGVCRIEPEGAEVSCLHRKRWHGATRLPDTASLQLKPGLLGGLSPLLSRGRYRYTEFLIRDGDPLYLLGHFVSDASGRRVLTLDQIGGQLIREWKRDFKQLLVRFDSDGNGVLDDSEWRQVQNAARAEAHNHQRQGTSREIEHAVSKPEASDLPYLIGSHGQEQLSRRFRWQALAGAAGFLGAGALATWLITSRLGGYY